MVVRRGFTLIEIIVALTLALIVAGAIHRLLVSTYRLSRTHAAQIDLQANVRTSAIVIANELRELNAVETGSADQNDILTVAATGLTYRAMRGIGFLCEPSTVSQIRLARTGFTGFRDPQPLRDGAYLFVAGTPGGVVEDAWVPLTVAGVATTVSCPGLGGPAITITTTPVAALAGAPVGTPVRLYETMELKLYRSDADWWLGARSVATGEAIQPLAGPLAGGDGLLLEYLDQAGASTTTPSAVKSVVVSVRVITEHVVSRADGQPLEEQLTSQVTLRNGVER
jgi:prepilin-type N-terminal cleavage/methylation domain-containing protein